MRKGVAILLVLVLSLRGFDSLVEGLAMLPFLMDHFHLNHHHAYHDRVEEDQEQEALAYTHVLNLEREYHSTLARLMQYKL